MNVAYSDQWSRVLSWYAQEKGKVGERVTRNLSRKAKKTILGQRSHQEANGRKGWERKIGLRTVFERKGASLKGNASLDK